MKRALLLSLVATPLLVFAACAGEDPGTPSVGGSGGGGNTPSSGSGGVAPISGSGGIAPQGGVAPSGGMGGGTAGTTPVGGSSGAPPVGGAAGMPVGGTAGTPAGGTAGTPAGGTAGTPAGGGGAGGVTGGTGGGGAVTIESLVGKLDGHLVVMPCGETPSTDDCKSAGATYNGKTTQCTVMGGTSFLDHVVEYPIMGESGKSYAVTMHFYGIMEPKNYGTANIVRQGGTQNTNIMTVMPLPWAQQMPPGLAYRPSNYNTYEIHVLNPAGAVQATYFINSDTTPNEGHYTFAINYEKTIPVIGGGKVRLRIFDANCRQIKNCTGGTSPCATKARSVNISAAMPQPPANTLMQPGLGQSSEHAGQWFLLDVKAVAPM